MFNTMRDLPYRILVMLVNIFFPPLAVMMLTGLGADTALNCLLFLLAVIPSHVHGFYLSWMYFWRRRKVRKGKYPGPPLSLIASKDVSNGGLSDKEVARLYRGEKGLERKVSGRSRRSKSKSRSRSRSRSASRSLSGSRAWEAHAAHRQQGGLLHGRGGRGLSARAGADEFFGRQGSKRVGRSRAGSQRSAVSSAGGGRVRDFERERRWAAQVAQDGYGPVLIQEGGIGSPASSGVGRVARH